MNSLALGMVSSLLMCEVRQMKHHMLQKKDLTHEFVRSLIYS